MAALEKIKNNKPLIRNTGNVPIQMSEEFTQNEFIGEIADVPILLMPIDENNYAISNTLDGLTNAYRYYKASEYIYQNYQPLCQYGKDYAVWCLKEKAADYQVKLEALMARCSCALIMLRIPMAKCSCFIQRIRRRVIQGIKS